MQYTTTRKYCASYKLQCTAIVSTHSYEDLTLYVYIYCICIYIFVCIKLLDAVRIIFMNVWPGCQETLVNPQAVAIISSIK